MSPNFRRLAKKACVLGELKGKAGRGIKLKQKTNSEIMKVAKKHRRVLRHRHADGGCHFALGWLAPQRTPCGCVLAIDCRPFRLKRPHLRRNRRGCSAVNWAKWRSRFRCRHCENSTCRRPSRREAGSAHPRFRHFERFHEPVYFAGSSVESRLEVATTLLNTMATQNSTFDALSRYHNSASSCPLPVDCSRVMDQLPFDNWKIQILVNFKKKSLQQLTCNFHGLRTASNCQSKNLCSTLSCVDHFGASDMESAKSGRSIEHDLV